VNMDLPSSMIASSANIEGWTQASELALALLLSAMVGVEREIRQKSAGLRTHTLVGVGAALFVLISKYGFNDVLQTGRVVLDPSRVAAQIVTGIGFLGAGLIFVRRDSVRGLTTAASIWVTAAIGACAGAGLPVLALLATGIYFVVAVGFPVVSKRLPRSSTASSMIRIRYRDGQGVLRTVLQAATGAGFAVEDLSTEQVGRDRGDSTSGEGSRPSHVEVTMHVHGKGLVNELAAALAEIDGVDAVVAGDANLVTE
jgi:putative Mg2+ transporter-C (MgtC) family protein